MDNQKKIETIKIIVNETKLYFKEYFNHLKRKLDIARKVDKEDVEISFLICFANIEGMATAWENRFNLSFNGDGERFREFMKKFCDLSYFKDKNLENHFWSTYRCPLAHSGLIESLFIDSSNKPFPVKMHFIGRFEKEKGKIVEKRIDGEYIQISSKVLFEIFENLINNFETHVKTNSSDFDNDFFTISTVKCSNCNNCYPDITRKCVFCGKTK